ncbi:hypothetical protein COCSUDRAFT_31919 [Coccomyxa subellipsoidea C-169]|uniref:Uncharacterized protein n=1 Tax=Coccomyxa subellipsoidea (strain C-169) TaxID=574566 RepID=I0Z8V9_COCSC|nr:hypothetical protein COCSUDRAFT_31919 [Coccomyxa subellipsoidea C-169]EIE27078.1 hypothetical protein COCSUDRAFT_31919 [Coccomyxa subellipsoidea C-169]|eukprot:XP_005651622.1 hypothetical protein COCSUDRAFT_31919 [Coccomyxa subellipsoidea C-169]
MVALSNFDDISARYPTDLQEQLLRATEEVPVMGIMLYCCMDKWTFGMSRQHFQTL